MLVGRPNFIFVSFPSVDQGFPLSQPSSNLFLPPLSSSHQHPRPASFSLTLAEKFSTPVLSSNILLCPDTLPPLSSSPPFTSSLSIAFANIDSLLCSSPFFNRVVMGGSPRLKTHFQGEPLLNSFWRNRRGAALGSQAYRYSPTQLHHQLNHHHVLIVNRELH